MKNKKKIIANFVKQSNLKRQGRKLDSLYFKERIAARKISYINDLIANTEQLVIVASLDFPKFNPV